MLPPEATWNRIVANGVTGGHPLPAAERIREVAARPVDILSFESTDLDSFPVIGGGFAAELLANEVIREAIYARLADETSREKFANIAELELTLTPSLHKESPTITMSSTSNRYAN